MDAPAGSPGCSSADDLGRIYLMLLPEVGNSIPVIRGLRHALGISLQTAKMALDDACDRAKRGR